MSGHKEAFLISIGIHLAVCMLAFGIMRGTAPERRPLIIDFSLVDRPAAAQEAQCPVGTESTASATEVPEPFPANMDREIPPVEDISEPAPRIQRTAVSEDQVPVAAPEPKPRSATVTRKSATRSGERKKTPEIKQGRRGSPPDPANVETTMEASTSALKPGTAGSAAGTSGSEEGHGPAGPAPSGPGDRRELPEMRYMKAHLARIRDAIIRKLSYPPLARSKGWAGTVKVSFVVNEDGNVKNVKVLAGSGFEVLDNNVVETVKRCSPFPKPPCLVEMIMPITYRLDE